MGSVNRRATVSFRVITGNRKLLVIGTPDSQEPAQDRASSVANSFLGASRPPDNKLFGPPEKALSRGGRWLPLKSRSVYEELGEAPASMAYPEMAGD